MWMLILCQNVYFISSSLFGRRFQLFLSIMKVNGVRNNTRAHCFWLYGQNNTKTVIYIYIYIQCIYTVYIYIYIYIYIYTVYIYICFVFYRIRKVIEAWDDMSMNDDRIFIFDLTMLYPELFKRVVWIYILICISLHCHTRAVVWHVDVMDQMFHAIRCFIVEDDKK